MYVDRLMRQGGASDWGICGVGVRPADKEMGDVLSAQDGLYTLVIKHADGRHEPWVIGSIVDFKYAPSDPDAVLDVLTAPQTRIVSLTITEGGYNFDQVTHDFDENNPAIQADLRTGATPSTVFGFVIEALARRRDLGIEPFTIMSCDNIESNGDMARKSFVAFAGLRDPALGEWVREHVCFPNSMVDRITPATTDGDRQQLEERFGLSDRWPVVCEPFTQWVLEDSFGSGRPAFEQAGVQVVPEVMPYELMKLRLLNAGHQALAYFGYLLGHRYVHDAAHDRALAEYVRAYMDREATPTLRPVPGVDLDRYKDELLERFGNPEVRDTVARLCAESTDRIPKWVLPVLRENLAHGGPIGRTTAIVASWARYAEGTDERGDPIVIVDRLADQVIAAAARQAHDPLALVRLPALFGDLVRDERFTRSYERILASLHEVGAAATLATLSS
jgi:mannitol 2-dehydrogenase